jgi:C4-dicarboxylate transporter DctQ subunit
MDSLKKLFRYYNELEKWVLIVLTVVMVIVIFGQVFTRYVLGNALYWSEELGKFIFVWISWLGVSAGMKEKEHIQVLMVHSSLARKGHKKTVKVLEIIVSVIWFFTSIVVLYHGYNIVVMQFQGGVYGASTLIPMWIPYLCIPLSALVVCIRLIVQAIVDTRELARLFTAGSREVSN